MHAHPHRRMTEQGAIALATRRVWVRAANPADCTTPAHGGWTVGDVGVKRILVRRTKSRAMVRALVTMRRLDGSADVERTTRIAALRNRVNHTCASARVEG